MPPSTHHSLSEGSKCCLAEDSHLFMINRDGVYFYWTVLCSLYEDPFEQLLNERKSQVSAGVMLKTKHNKTASRLQVSTGKNNNLSSQDEKKTSWHILHRKVIRYLPPVWVCVCVCVCEQQIRRIYPNVRVLFLQLVLPVHHGYDGLTQLHCSGERPQWEIHKTHTDNTHSNMQKT